MVANSLGFDPEATRRVFRAHHWEDRGERIPTRGIDR
jgi:hypothetical protein